MGVCVLWYSSSLLSSSSSLSSFPSPPPPPLTPSSAKPNESLKLMLVGLQRMGKTTLLSRLREVNEVHMTASTFNERVRGEDGKQTKSKKKGGK